MRFSTVSTAALAPALALAYGNYKQNGVARVHNRCNYDVYLWSVQKDMGCDDANMKVLKKGETHEETYRDDYSAVGVSIKLSKSNKCKYDGKGNKVDITQLEYRINHDDPQFFLNFVDISFVDCEGKTCPGRESLYWKVGNNGDAKLAAAGENNSICPKWGCSSVESCGDPYQVYTKWDDHWGTKSCEPSADTDLYLCVSDPDDLNEGDGYGIPEPSKPKQDKKPKPTPKEKPSKPEEKPVVTPKPSPPPKKVPNVKTIVNEVVVTKYEYVYAKPGKKHGHGHGHRKFRA